MNGIQSKLALCVAIVNFQFYIIYAQNLVLNPSFEDFVKCPGSYSQDIKEFRVRHWSSANTATPDHFHSCSAGEASVPYNWAGVSDAHHGEGYAGIYVWMNSDKDYREYLQGKMNIPLIADSTYIVEFYYRLSSYSMYAADRIGILISNSEVKEQHDKVLRLTPTQAFVQDSALTMSTGLWEKALFEYKAKGGEAYIIIGNFANNTDTRIYKIRFQPVQQSMLERSAYYFVDHISVVSKFSPKHFTIDEEIPVYAAENTELDKTYILKNVQFEFNSYKLKAASFEELDKVVQWLEAHPNVKVQLYGHTDDIGNDKYNLLLSRNRAKNIMKYLTAQGVNSVRIESYGYGKSRPLINDVTDEARSLNRRVEIKFLR